MNSISKSMQSTYKLRDAIIRRTYITENHVITGHLTLTGEIEIHNPNLATVDKFRCQYGMSQEIRKHMARRACGLR